MASACSQRDRVALGLDLGGTKIAAGLIRDDGSILSRGEIPTRADEGVSSVVNRMARLAREVAGEYWEGIAAVGVGCPGPLDHRTGTVLFAPNLHGWVDVPIKQLLAEEMHKPVHVENDANAAAFGEARFGLDEPVSHLLYLTVSTGIGGGMVIGDQPYRGAFGGAAEVGHMTVDPSGPRCGCGNHGCLEAFSSGTAIAAAVTAAIKAGERSLALDMVDGDLPRLDARVITEAAAGGDELCSRVLNRALRYLGIGIASLVNLFDPAVIAIGGGLSRIGEPLLDAVRCEIKARSLPPGRDQVLVKIAGLGTDSGLIGAAALVMDSR